MFYIISMNKNIITISFFVISMKETRHMNGFETKIRHLAAYVCA